MAVLKQQLNEQGYATRPFSSEMQKVLVQHIENYVRKIAAPYLQGKDPNTHSLEQLAARVPDDIWAQLMTRAFRIFPSELGEKLAAWADSAFRQELGAKRSAINVVYLQETETNKTLHENSLSIYWRCVRPGKADAGRAHRDVSFFDLEFKEGYNAKIPFRFNHVTDCIKIWIPLKGCIPTTTLQIIPRSHKMDIPTTVEATEYGRRPGISDAWLQEHEKDFMSPVELSQGSCILFDMNTVHRGPRHNHSQLRVSAELNFFVEW